MGCFTPIIKRLYVVLDGILGFATGPQHQHAKGSIHFMGSTLAAKITTHTNKVSYIHIHATT